MPLGVEGGSMNLQEVLLEMLGSIPEEEVVVVVPRDSDVVGIADTGAAEADGHTPAAAPSNAASHGHWVRRSVTSEYTR